MPILPPALDDRGYDDLVAELLARVPAHTPEWTNPRPGDPGRTMVELFAWLADTILYRANLIPERQRLAFLRLLGEPMRGAQAARGLVSLSAPRQAEAVQLRALATLKAPVPFETRGEVTVLPVEGMAYHKRALTGDEADEMKKVIGALTELYGLDDDPDAVAVPYVTTAVFAGGAADPAGFDLVQQSVDASLWIALLAAKDVTVEQARAALGGRQLLNVGVAPAVEVAGVTELIGKQRGGVPVVWEMSTPNTDANGDPVYLALDVVEDGTAELTRRGVVRLALPGEKDIGAPQNDVGQDPMAGTGPLPPRLDAPDEQERLVCWIRMRPAAAAQTLPLSWVGINAVEADQRQTVTARIVGESDGTADQVMQLPATSIEPESLQLQVEEPERGYVDWRRTDDLNTAGRDDRVYLLDAEAGTVRFGDGVRGQVPRGRMRVRVATMRAGGGQAGNVPAGSISKASGVGHDGRQARLDAFQPLPMEGGDDAETLAEAERRIPQLFRHRNRAVTEDDYRHLAAAAPGVRAGRVEVLPRFKPHQRRANVPGVVSVMVLPRKELRHAPNPRPDRPFLERVHLHLDPLRPVTTELYVIGCEYVPLGLATSIHLAEGAGRDTTTHAVREALRAYLWPLDPGGPNGGGWPLGRRVSDRELEVVIARVPGVQQVVGVNLFRRNGDLWGPPVARGNEGEARVELREYELPELLQVVVLSDGSPVPGKLDGVPDPFANRTEGGEGSEGGPTGPAGPGGPAGTGGPRGPRGRRRRPVGIPVVPEVC